MGTEFLIVFAFLLANGLFAGAEIAVLSVRKTRLSEFIRRRDKRALAVKKLRDHPERFLATVQIAITTVGTAAAAFGGAKLEHSLRPKFEAIGLGANASLATVIILIVFLELVVGELVPKSLALRYSDRYSFFVGRPLVFLSTIMRPLVWLLPSRRTSSCGSSATRPRSPRPGCRATSCSSWSRKRRRPARSIRAPARSPRARSGSARSPSPR
jgi:putative hemolysin